MSTLRRNSEGVLEAKGEKEIYINGKNGGIVSCCFAFTNKKEDEIMVISGVADYTNTYAGYTNSANSKKQVTEETSAAKETGSADRKTAAVLI